jgi:hypothetical protein
VISFLIWLRWVIDLRGLNSNLRYFNSFTFISVSFVESCLLVSSCAGDRCDMTCSDEDHGRSWRSSAEDHGWSRYVRFIPCMWRLEARVSLIEPQNQDLWFVSGLTWKPQRRFLSGLTSKPLIWSVSGLASKPLRRFLPVWPKNRWRRFIPV